MNCSALEWVVKIHRRDYFMKFYVLLFYDGAPKYLQDLKDRLRHVLLASMFYTIQ